MPSVVVRRGHFYPRKAARQRKEDGVGNFDKMDSYWLGLKGMIVITVVIIYYPFSNALIIKRSWFPVLLVGY
jgi:hypothetical protein